MRSQFTWIIAGVLVVVGLIVASMSLFTVDQREQVLVLQFGDVRRVISEPGLKAKVPFLQNVQRFDKRLLEFDAPAQEVIAADQKRLLVDAFARYRIVDSLRYFQTVRNEIGLRSSLGSLINDNLREVLGTVSLQTVISDERAELLRRISRNVQAGSEKFGIDVIDVRIRRADLPAANSEAIFRRMQTERQQEAAELRAKGAEEAQKIRARADRDKVVMVAEAERDADILRGEGEGEMNRIFADAFGRDPEFFAFYRTMQAYEQALGEDDTTMVLSPNSEFFRYFGAFGDKDSAPRLP